MDRTQIYLTEAERDALDRRAAASGTTRSHLIREAIAVYLRQPTLEELERTLLASSGAWKREGAADVDGAAYVERLRTGRRWSELGVRRAAPPRKKKRSAGA